MQTTLFSTIINTPIGELYALADEHAILMLGFADVPATEQYHMGIEHSLKSPIIEKEMPLLTALKHEIDLYFSHQLQQFTVPIKFFGTPFQESAWKALTTIPYGKTCSYKEQAALLGKPTASRAVGTANGANMLVIIVPCHRVIAHNGSLGGYSGTLERKKWLLEHESAKAL